MRNNPLFYVELAASFLPFILFAYLNGKANMKREVRSRQYAMPVVAVVFSLVLLVFLSQVSNFLLGLVYRLLRFLEEKGLEKISEWLRNIFVNWGVYLSLVLFNTAAMVGFVTIKRIITAALAKRPVKRASLIGKVVELFYHYDEEEGRWYVRPHCGQARGYIMAGYYGSCILSGLVLLISCGLCMKGLVTAPFYPVFAVIIMGELAFFLDGEEQGERRDGSLSVERDRSRHIAMYPLLRKPLRALFGDKLSAEGTTVNNGSAAGGAVEDILLNLERNGGHVGKNYSAFIRKKMSGGLKPNGDYVRSGYDLATGKSLLFNTPFYDKLNPYVFYAMNRELITGGKVLIVLGRHGTEEDLRQWCENGMQQVSNIPQLWKIDVLTGTKTSDEDDIDIGIISRSGVHDLNSHKKNLAFLRKVSFVVVIEPSRLVTTAQIGLNLLIKCCGQDRSITFCSVDRNCDGLVDALSHILMTNITEVSATEYPNGMSSFMYWTADSEYLQHRILPGVSRFLGMGTELSAVALKNQVKQTVWYGGDTFPVQDARWIAKQYYHDLLEYAQLPTTQETFDKCFQTSHNMCNERVKDYSYITVEDDRNNLFETRRNFATIAQEQGFVNVISSEYMLREYMAENTQLFTADAKAIPYITADYARTKRNAILSVCLLLCIDSVPEQVLLRQLMMQNMDTKDPVSAIWKEICLIFGGSTEGTDKYGRPTLTVIGKDGSEVTFEKSSTILFKRVYSVESGKFESVYTIENSQFAQLLLDDLQNAVYIAEQESKDVYIGTELKGHVYQKYLPGQFFTLGGKYYEMISTTADNRILVRRASEHISGRLAYRQVRNYTIHHLADSDTMGALKSVNNIDIHYQYADFTVETPGFWKLGAYNDFDGGQLVTLNGVPQRRYFHKQILKLDFSKMGEAFTDSVRMTLTNLLNEVFVSLFAENQPFISAITPGSFDAPVTYSLNLEGSGDKCIYIVEDSQLDIGLLIAVERNAHRIFQIIADYLDWNADEIEKSLHPAPAAQAEKAESTFNVYEETEEDKPKKKKCFLMRFFAWLKKIFQKFFAWLKKLFKGKKKDKTPKNAPEETAGADGDAPSTEGAAAEAAETVAETGDAAEAAEATDEAAETTDETAEATDEAAETTDETAEVTGETAEATDETAEATDETAEATDETAEVTDETAEVTDETAETTDETAEVTDEAAEVTDETAQAEENGEVREDA